MSSELESEMEQLSKQAFTAFTTLVTRRKAFVDDCYRVFVKHLDNEMHNYLDKKE